MKIKTKDGEIIDLALLSRPELQELRLEFLARLGEVKSQLETANMRYVTEGISADYEWRVRARGAQRVIGQQVQTIAAEFSRRNKENKEIDRANYVEKQRTFGGLFVKHAKKILSHGQYGLILDAVLAEEALLEGKNDGDT